MTAVLSLLIPALISLGLLGLAGTEALDLGAAMLTWTAGTGSGLSSTCFGW